MQNYLTTKWIMILHALTDNETTIALDATHVMLSASEASAFRMEKKQILRRS
jgi:hypothetical protein